MSLTLYRLRDSIDGQDVVDPTVALRSLDAADEHEPDGEWDFEPRLFLGRSVLRFPEWARKLMSHFPEDTFHRVRSAGAVMFATAPSFPGTWYAFTWGHRGRHLLRPDSYVRHFGLRTALNVIYSTEGDGGERVRSVDAKTVSANTLRTRTQSDRRATFEDFRVDARRDLLYGITGRPADTEAWGSRVSGTDRLSVTKDVPFDQFGTLCDLAEEAYAEKHYEQNFSWIDDLAAVADPSLTEALLEKVVEGLKAGESPFELAVPEIVEWGDIARFRFSFDEEVEFVDPEDMDVATALEDAGRLERLSVNGIKRAHRLEAMNAEGERVGAWPILRCLSGEMEFDEDRFILSEGDFFKVRAGLIAELADFVDSLPHSQLDLPPSPGDIREDEYNAHTVESLDGTLLLDKRTVRIEGATSPIEVCDILSAERRFVHVKRKLGSSQLSHLFSQGARSCELAVISADFRRATLEKIAEVSGEAHLDPEMFSPFDEDHVDAATLWVDYAVVARWNGRSPSEALPFFSQLNLRSFVRQIDVLRANVTLTPIEVQD